MRRLSLASVQVSCAALHELLCRAVLRLTVGRTLGEGMVGR